jgi:hypothetical protein
MRGELVTDPATHHPVLGKWDAPATPDEWRALVEISRENGARRGTRLTNGSSPPWTPLTSLRKYLFSGFLRCGAVKDGVVCHSSMGGCARPTARHPDNAVYVCTAMDCGGTARNARAVDAYLSEVVSVLLSECHAPDRADHDGWDGEELLRQLVEEHAAFVRDGATPGRVAAVADLPARISGLEAARAEHLAAVEAQQNDAGPQQWQAPDLGTRRKAIARVLHSVVVMPLPPGTSRRAAFDPDLLRVIPKKPPRR